MTPAICFHKDKNSNEIFEHEIAMPIRVIYYINYYIDYDTLI